MILGSVRGRLREAFLLVLKVLDQLTKAFDGLSIKPGFLDLVLHLHGTKWQNLSLFTIAR